MMIIKVNRIVILLICDYYKSNYGKINIHVCLSFELKNSFLLQRASASHTN